MAGLLLRKHSLSSGFICYAAGNMAEDSRKKEIEDAVQNEVEKVSTQLIPSQTWLNFVFTDLPINSIFYIYFTSLILSFHQGEILIRVEKVKMVE